MWHKFRELSSMEPEVRVQAHAQVLGANEETAGRQLAGGGTAISAAGRV
jgi:hypothetical protein